MAAIEKDTPLSVILLAIVVKEARPHSMVKRVIFYRRWSLEQEKKFVVQMERILDLMIPPLLLKVKSQRARCFRTSGKRIARKGFLKLYL